jgi:stage II sporulation protein AA (anti-sigma F factor antagonist)
MISIVSLLKQGVLVIHLTGELDMHIADEFRMKVDLEIDKYGVKNLILNLENVSFIDSSGLGVILGRYKKLSQSGGSVSIVEVSEQVKHILELAGMLKIIKLFPDEEAALQNL